MEENKLFEEENLKLGRMLTGEKVYYLNKHPKNLVFLMRIFFL